MLLSASLRNQRLLLIVIVAQFADLVTFLPAINRVGIGAEQNPIVRDLFLAMGAAGPAAFKVCASVAVVALLYRVAVRYPNLAGRSCMVAVGLGLLGAWSNIAFGLVS